MSSEPKQVLVDRAKEMLLSKHTTLWSQFYDLTQKRDLQEAAEFVVANALEFMVWVGQKRDDQTA